MEALQLLNDSYTPIMKSSEFFLVALPILATSSILLSNMEINWPPLGMARNNTAVNQWCTHTTTQTVSFQTPLLIAVGEISVFLSSLGISTSRTEATYFLSKEEVGVEQVAILDHWILGIQRVSDQLQLGLQQTARATSCHGSRQGLGKLQSFTNILWL